MLPGQVYVGKVVRPASGTVDPMSLEDPPRREFPGFQVDDWSMKSWNADRLRAELDGWGSGEEGFRRALPTC